MSGLVCRTLLWTSVAFNTTTQISLELATPPRGSNDDGLAVCFMGSNYELKSSTAVNSSIGSGDQFNIDENSTPVSIGSIEYTSFWELLRNDTFFQDTELLRCVVLSHS
jgi:hypothetical protein